jgi:protein-S-isoprenylcysteine O-methyltransferase Ste14
VLRYRLANPAPATWNILKTIAVIAVFDAVVVWGIPALVLVAQQSDTDFDLSFPPQVVLGVGVLTVSTLLVLWGGLTLAIKGRGTPLWIDAPQRLVVSGPYAWLRTPMVTGTLGQVAGVGVITGSPFVLLLVPVIALAWNTIVRPPEEELMQHFFGRNFELYRRSVRCWLPMRSAWKPPPDRPPIALSELPERPARRRKRG